MTSKFHCLYMCSKIQARRQKPLGIGYTCAADLISSIPKQAGVLGNFTYDVACAEESMRLCPRCSWRQRVFWRVKKEILRQGRKWHNTHRICIEVEGYMVMMQKFGDLNRGRRRCRQNFEDLRSNWVSSHGRKDLMLSVRFTFPCRIIL